MPKFRSIKRKKRKFKGNRFCKKENPAVEEVLSQKELVETSQKSESDQTDDEQPDQYMEPSSSSFSASASKLEGKYSDLESESELETTEGFRFIDISILTSIFGSFWCPVCKHGHVVMEEDRQAKMGFASLLVLKCTSSKCSFLQRFYTSSRVEKSKAFEVNRRIVLATRNIGVGHQGLVKFAGVMNMLSPMNENAYRDHVDAIRNAAEHTAKESMRSAVEEIKEFYECDADGVFDIGVSGDGTWRKRGFSSSSGVVTAISLLTGKALDVEIMSKECRECMGWRDRQGTAEFHEWWESHQAHCHANFIGSSGSMDASGILAIFQRSIENYSLRYVDFLGDGDSKSHNLLVSESVYGNVEVTKLECVGHIQKRMGSRLRSLIKRTGQARLEDGKGLGGRGRLTDKTIDNLQVYYEKAIRENTHDVGAMQNAIMAIWHHTQATDDNPDHDLCPPGEHSWCGFQRDQAKGTTDYHHNHPLPAAVAKAILPCFEALSDLDLLRRCLHGGTQNRNEALNALIWQRATKETHSGLPVVELATFLAVAHFNDGAVSLITILKELGIAPGVHCVAACSKLDYNRIRHSRRKSSEAAKKRRKQLRNWKRGYSETLEAREGPSY